MSNKKTPGVAFYGKVRIATIGHRKAIDQAKGIAKNTGGKLTIGLSGTSEPLTPALKKKHAETVFQHPVMSGNEHTKTLSHFLTHMSRNHDELHLVAGSDRAGEYRSFLEKYNGKKDRSGKVPFHFKSWKVHEVSGERTESNKDPRKMNRDELERSVSASKVEKLAKEGNYDHFKAYHPDMPEHHVRKLFTTIRAHHGLNEAAIGLTFARSALPQLGASKSFVKYLKDNGVEADRKKINPNDLKSSQMEFDDDKIMSLRNKPSNNPIVVSNDGYVLDGHHRWLADHQEGRDSDAYVCDLPILELLHKARYYKEEPKGSLNEEITRKQLAPMLDSFVSFASDKLGIKSIPNIRYKSEDDDYNSFAAYNPSANELSISTLNRHPMDIFRSVAHELVHHKQNEDGRLGKDIAKEGETGSDIENEANSEAGKIMRWFAKEQPNMFGKSYVIEETLNEGINDPGKLKAVFLAGGPGSGKDFVMNKTLIGNGLREINSDTAFEFLMKKHGLDMEMPDEERVEREVVRGRAKNITSRKEISSLAGRLGLIVNGTADDLEKIKTVKSELEDLGYDTMMVFVNTSNEVSRQRNVERGKSGNRKVPDGTDKQGVPDNSPNIRQEKWDLAQKNIGALQNIFGKDNFTVIDNTADIRKVTPDEKERIEADFNRVRRMTMQFVQSPVKNKRGNAWTERSARYKGVQYTAPKSLSQIRQQKPIETPNTIIKPSNELMDQARRLGLSYYGFGRFGRKVNGKNKVLYHSVGGKLVRATMTEEKKMGNPCWSGYKAYGMKKKNGKEVPNCVPVEEGRESIDMEKEYKKHNRLKKKINRPLAENINSKFETFMEEHGAGDWGTTKLTNRYKKDTPGEKVKKKIVAKEDNVLPRGGLPVADGIGPEMTQYRPMTAVGYSLAESIVNWMNNPKTQQKFAEKYGDLAEQKLMEAAIKLDEAGCGCKSSKGKKSIQKIKEGMGLGYNDQSPIGKQSKDEVDEDWQKINRKDGAGMSQKAVNAYRRENPGSKLKTAVTKKPSELKSGSKAANRRKSFCARMGGMKKRLTSAKTANDPDSRINKALRKWNCEE